jgi:hypothetical protein
VNYRISSHAFERIRQRFGIDTLAAALTWVSEKIKGGDYIGLQAKGRKVYRNGDAELILGEDGYTIVTVKFAEGESQYVEQIGDVVRKEVSKMLTIKERAFRKAEIEVAEITLNMLKARNPVTKELIGRKLTKAIDDKANINTEIILIRKAAEQYGVEV